MARRAVERPGGREAVAGGEILFAAAAGAHAVDACHGPPILQARGTRRKTDHDERRHEHEVQARHKDASSGDHSEGVERLRRAGEALYGCRHPHGHIRPLRRRAECGE